MILKLKKESATSLINKYTPHQIICVSGRNKRKTKYITYPKGRVPAINNQDEEKRIKQTTKEVRNPIKKPNKRTKLCMVHLRLQALQLIQLARNRLQLRIQRREAVLTGTLGVLLRQLWLLVWPRGRTLANRLLLGLRGRRGGGLDDRGRRGRARRDRRGSHNNRGGRGSRRVSRAGGGRLGRGRDVVVVLVAVVEADRGAIGDAGIKRGAGG